MRLCDYTPCHSLPLSLPIVGHEGPEGPVEEIEEEEENREQVEEDGVDVRHLQRKTKTLFNAWIPACVRARYG